MKVADEKPPRLFKLHTATRNGGDVQLFEREGQFAEAVLDALIAAYGNDTRHEPRRVWMACRTWWNLVMHRDEEDPDMRIERVIKVQEFINGEWVDLNPHLVEPFLLWHREPDPNDPGKFIATKEL